MVKPLQIFFKGSVLRTIGRLKNHSGVKHRGEVIRDALKLYDVMDKIAKSGKVVVRDYDRKSERVIKIPRKKQKKK